MFEYFEGQGSMISAISYANKRIKQLEGSWKAIQFETYSEETQAFGQMFYVIVLFEQVERL